MLQLVDAGSLAPGDVSAVAERLGDWWSLVRIVSPGEGEPMFRVDLDADDGAVRHDPAQAVEGDLLLLDTRRLAAHLLKAEAAVRQKLLADPLSPRARSRAAQLSLLLKLGRQLDPRGSPLMRRDPRAVASGKRLAIPGFARICSTLHREDRAGAAGIHAVLEIGRDPRPSTQGDSISAAIFATRRKAAYAGGVEECELRDLSSSGVRLSMPVNESTAIGIGTLVALWAEGQDAWAIGVVRRVRRASQDRADVALEMLANTLLGVELEGSASEAGYTVNGEAVRLSTTRYRALYLGAPVATHVGRSLVVPRNIHSPGAEFALGTARARYEVRLGNLLELGSDWVWCALDVLAPEAGERTLPSTAQPPAGLARQR